MVAQKLTLYHQSLLQSLEPQTYSFFEHVMEEAKRRSIGRVPTESARH